MDNNSDVIDVGITGTSTIVLTSISLIIASSPIVACKNLFYAKESIYIYIYYIYIYSSLDVYFISKIQRIQIYIYECLSTYFMNEDDRAYDVNVLGCRQCTPGAMLGQPRND